MTEKFFVNAMYVGAEGTLECPATPLNAYNLCSFAKAYKHSHQFLHSENYVFEFDDSRELIFAWKKKTF